MGWANSEYQSGPNQVDETICVEACPIGILTLDETEGPRVRPGMGRFCIGCGHCVAVCPHGAINNARSPLERQVGLPAGPVLEPEQAWMFLRARRSIRCYRDEAVPRDAIRRLLEVARFAPTAHNSQGLSFLVVEGKETVRRLTELVVEWMRQRVQEDPKTAQRQGMPGLIRAYERGEDKVLRDAPQVIVASAPKSLGSGPTNTHIALEYVELYATALGLGTCWAGFAQACGREHPPFTAFLGIPEDRVITGILMLGYPRHTYFRLPDREPLELSWFDPQRKS